ncbi:Ger(x)C family spore germination protein [Paenibacillus sp. MWE-103]|uniref:Ger(X)C family spore germination protein n=1 Tax=Paenibacillus artemisiicola TaxID=1172618 RepID=A0ABS3W660_9BACL|nr:Ger(x)C family spore germination protein [Paenibacillus artemisiicola]MBO7743789.1 Ger(x)C family spore germination protein [Paenibacillus artemisiicola]
MKPLICIGLLILIVIISGCWDRKEINDLAFVSGSAIDLTNEGKILGTLQIPVPGSGQGSPSTGGGGSQEKFFVITGESKNISEGVQELQKKSSRQLFTAHRSVIFIGEPLARHGIEDVLDYFTHDPRNRLTTYMMVVKGTNAKEILQTKYPFELVPIEAVKEMEILGSESAVTLRDFFIAASSEGIYPVMGVIKPDFTLAGTAIFKNFKLIGYLNEKETYGFLWVADKIKRVRIYADLPQVGGNVNVRVSRATSKMIPQINGNRVKFKVLVHGEGRVDENNTSLDLNQPGNLALVRKAAEQSIKSQIQDFLFQSQKHYRTDVAGFGRKVYRDHPRNWRLLKDHWDRRFSEADVSVSVQINLRGSGLGSRPLHIKEKENKK